MVVIPAGARSSLRAPNRKCYSELDDSEDFPDLPKPALKVARARRDLLPKPSEVVQLTAANDPIRGRDPLPESTDISEDELNGFVYADISSLEIVGDFAHSLMEWNLSMLVTRDLAGGVIMRDIRNIVSEVVVDPSPLLQLATKNLVLQRRVVPSQMLDWFKTVEDHGWCGWVMIEWLHRRRSSPGCSPLRPSRILERGELALFLATIADGMAPGAYRSVVQKCVARLRLPAHSAVTREDGLWFDSHMLSHLRLPFPVYVWDITGSIATLTSSTNWGVGPHSLEQVTEACSGLSHMSFSLGHMFPFPLGCGTAHLIPEKPSAFHL